MTSYNDGRHGVSDFTERVNSIVDQILELLLLYDCQTYFLVEYDHGILTFNSVEDGLWPPPDHTMESLHRPVKRIFSFQEILNRVTEEGQKELIQLLLFIAEVAEGPLIFGSNRLEVGGWEQGDSGDSEDSKDSEDSEMGGLESVEGDEEDDNTTDEEGMQGEEKEKGELGEEGRSGILGNEEQRYEAFGWDSVGPHWSKFA